MSQDNNSSDDSENISKSKSPDEGKLERKPDRKLISEDLKEAANLWLQLSTDAPRESRMETNQKEIRQLLQELKKQLSQFEKN